MRANQANRSEPLTANDLIREFEAAVVPERAAILARFFKTGPGEYGEGDRFLGIDVPTTRRIARRYHKLAAKGISWLLTSEWHEVRLAALVILVNQFEAGGEKERGAIVRLYLRSTDRINNWDLVDASAPYILGAYLSDRPKDVLYDLAGSSDLWERRIAIVATLGLIRRNDLEPTFGVAEMLLGDPHDLIHKACGWALREAGKRSETRLIRFIRTNYPNMSRTALRYAIERFPPERRKQILQNIWA